MWLVGARAQQVEAPLYAADLTLTGAAQLVMGVSVSRSYLYLQNISTHNMNVEIGGPRAHATISGGAVATVVIDNAGFNYTYPPKVAFVGGGPQAGQRGGPYLGLNQPNGTSHSHPASGHAVLTTGAVSSIVIDDPGAGYLCPPYVYVYDDVNMDPYGCALPSATSGISLPFSASTPSVPLIFNGTFCPTGPISVLGTSGDVLVCRWAE